MIHYSIIIPHKNMPQLLRRCLDSIPQRNDIEVIVVDDSSDEPYREELKALSEVYSPTCRFIFTNEGKGAGYARNVGMRESCGKWLLFADADDYYTPDFMEALDVYKDSTASVICFSVKKTIFGKSIVYIPENNKKQILFAYSEPWGKMFDRKYITMNYFCFEENEVANNVMFVVEACHYAPELLIDESLVYVFEARKDGLSSLQSKSHVSTRFELALKLNRFAVSVGAREYRLRLMGLLRIYCKGDLSMLWSLLLLIAKYKQMGWLMSCFTEVLKREFCSAFLPPKVERGFICKHDKQLIYLNNSKVACSSIKASMFRDFDNYNDIHVFTRRYSIPCLTPEVKSYYKFTFVRNPYQRLVSCYENKVVQENDYFKDYLSGEMCEVSDFDGFIRKVVAIPDRKADPHFQSQYKLIYTRWGKCLVDYVGKFENIKQDYESIRLRFDLKPLPHKNKVTVLLGKNWMDYYTLETAELVYAKYKKDFIWFTYTDEYYRLKAYLVDKANKQ